MAQFEPRFWILVLSCLMAVSHAFNFEEFRDNFRAKRQAEDFTTPSTVECSKPPRNYRSEECCSVPKEEIWGDLRDSFQICFKQMKAERRARKSERQEMFNGTEGNDEFGPSSGEEPAPPPPQPDDGMPGGPPTEEDPSRGGRPDERPPKPRWSPRQFFDKVFTFIKKTIDALVQCILMITDHFRRRQNDGCLMECVFEDQGFLTEKMVDKNKIAAHLQASLAKKPEWLKIAMKALDTCTSEVQVAANRTCQSGSDETFRCVFKHIFLECPTWNEESRYCSDLKDFYQQCPDGPPPEMGHHRRHHHHHHHHDDDNVDSDVQRTDRYSDGDNAERRHHGRHYNRHD